MAAASQFVAVAQVPVTIESSTYPVPSPPSSAGRSASPDTQDSASSIATSPEHSPVNGTVALVAIPVTHGALQAATDELQDPAHPRRETPTLRLAIPPKMGDEAIEEASPQSAQDPALELCFEDDLTVVERAYLFAQSNSVFHRIYIARELPSLLDDAPSAEAVTYILPLLNPLATDSGVSPDRVTEIAIRHAHLECSDLVKEALVAGIVDIIWWFFTHCEVVNGDPPEGERDPPVISVHAFTPLLGSLLMDLHTTVGTTARLVVVELLNRIHSSEWMSPEKAIHLDEERCKLVEWELLVEVTVGLARLDGPQSDDTNVAASDDAASSIVGRFFSAEEPTFDDNIVVSSIHHGPEDTGIASSSNVLHNNLSPPRAQNHADLETLVLKSKPDVGVPLGDLLASSAAVDDQRVSSDVLTMPWMDISKDPRDGNTASYLSDTQDLIFLSSAIETVVTSGPPSDLTAHVAADNPPDPPPDTSRDHVYGSNMETATNLASRIPSYPSAGISEGRVAADIEPRSGSPPPKSIPFSDYSPNAEHPSDSSDSSFTSSSMHQSPALSPDRDASPQSFASPPASSRFAHPNHIALPPQPVFPSHSSPNGAPQYHSPEVHTEAAAAFFPGTPFPQEGEARDPMGQHNSGNLTVNMHTASAPYMDEAGITSDDVAVGRVSSMSLIATLAAYADNPISSEVQRMFVAEVVRLRDDPEITVRREATVALGALAKVVPIDILITYLLPLFEHWLHDENWNVRQAAIFSLPNILSRLPPKRRRALVLTVLPVHASDENSTVQSSVLEVLGEVIFTFKDDRGGPPPEILALFLRGPSGSYSGIDNSSWHTLSPQNHNLHMQPANDIKFQDPSRELTCAFNFPAVALTLGSSRWHEIRTFYFHLARSKVHKVRRTIAASIGEIARIVGRVSAAQDLVNVWRDSVRSVEQSSGDIRLKAVNALPTLLEALSVEDRQNLAGELEEIWAQSLIGWRERERLASSLHDIAGLLDSRSDIVWCLLLKALKDPFSAVREAAIKVLPDCFVVMRSYLFNVLPQLDALSNSLSFRDRHTYTTCCMSLCMDDRNAVDRPEMWQHLDELSLDAIVDVRIGVARTAGVICEKYFADVRLRPERISSLIWRLDHDDNEIVRAYVCHIAHPGATFRKAPSRASNSFAAFHDPPPTTVFELPHRQPSPDSLFLDVSNGSRDADDLLTPSSGFDLPSSIDWSTNDSLMDESLSDDSNPSDESFGTLNYDDPSVDPWSRSNSSE